MEPIGAALQGLIDNSAGVAAEFRVERAGDEIHFRQRIGVDRNAGLVEKDVVDVRAVQEEGVLSGLAAVGGKGAIAVLRLHHSRRGLLKLDRIAAKARQFFEFRGPHHILELHIGGFHLEGRRNDLDGLRRSADLQLCVDLEGGA